MNLYIDEVKIEKNKIVGIFDIDDKVTPNITKDFLRAAEKNGEAEIVGFDLPKSFLLLDEKNSTRKCSEQKVLFTHLSAKTLVGRAEETLADIIK